MRALARAAPARARAPRPAWRGRRRQPRPAAPCDPRPRGPASAMPRAMRGRRGRARCRPPAAPRAAGAEGRSPPRSGRHLSAHPPRPTPRRTAPAAPFPFRRLRVCRRRRGGRRRLGVRGKPGEDENGPRPPGRGEGVASSGVHLRYSVAAQRVSRVATATRETADAGGDTAAAPPFRQTKRGRPEGRPPK